MAARIESEDMRNEDGTPSVTVTGPSGGSRRALILPVSLAMGWGVLLGYSTVLLTNDTPVRPETGTAQAALNEPGPFENTAASSRLPRANAPWSDVGLGSAHAGAPARDRLAASPAQPGIRPVALKQDTEVTPRADAPAAASPPIEAAAYVGVWGPNEVACRRGARRRGIHSGADHREWRAGWKYRLYLPRRAAHGRELERGGILQRWRPALDIPSEADRRRRPSDMVERQGRRLLRPVQSPRRVNTADTEVSPALCRDGLKYRAKVSRIHVGQIRPRHDI